MRSLCIYKERSDCEVKKDLNLLLEISNELNASDINLDNVIKLLQKQLKADVIVIYVLNRKRDLIFVEGTYGLKDKTNTNITYKVGEGVIGNVIKDGNTVIVPCISECKEFTNKLGMPLKIDNHDV